MTIRIGSNIASLQAQRRLGEATSKASTAMERLSSGLRINKASDDPAGLSIATSLNANSRIFNQALRNANDTISLTSIAEGALTALQGITARQKELAEQAANGSYSLTQRKALNNEANTLADEFNRIVASTQFNGLSILSPQTAATNYSVQLGSGNENAISYNTSTDLARNVGLATFSNPTATSTSSSTDGGRLIDVNNDGKLDLVTVSNSNILTKLGNGDGSFANSVTSTVPGLIDSNPRIDLGDLNGDGFADLIVGDTNTAGNSKILIGNANGTFTYAGSINLNGGSGVKIADFNNDGKLDVLINSLTGSSTVALGNGNGTFGAKISTGATSSIGNIGDFNGDGIQDIYSIGASGIGVQFGKGDGSFGNATYTASSFAGYTNGGYNIGSTTDLNGDGFDDLIVSLSSLSGADFGIFLSNGNGTFTTGSIFGDAFSSNGPLVSKDLNNDGIADLQWANYLGLNVSIGKGDGTFGAITSFGPVVGNLLVGDLNGDGVVDLVGVNTSTSSVLLANTIKSTKIQKLNILTQVNARATLNILEDQQNRITANLGTIGAFQSRLSVAANTLLASKEQFDAASSRITSADIAEESARFVASQVLQQAATAVLAQANQSPTLALTLLGQFSK